MWKNCQAEAQVGYSVRLQSVGLREAVPNSSSQISFRLSSLRLVGSLFFEDVNNISQPSDSALPTWTYETVFADTIFHL